MPRFLASSFVIALMLASACAEPPQTPTSGTRVRVVEAYGDKGNRSVTLSALVSPASEGVVQISDVSIDVVPDKGALVQKLETLLEDVDFHWRVGQSDFPQLTRSMPAEAVPMIRRLQLALLIVQGADNFSAEEPLLDLTPSRASMGLTRVARQDGNVVMGSIALAMPRDATTFAWGHARGALRDGALHLAGTRRVGTASPESISLVITGTTETASPPAGR